MSRLHYLHTTTQLRNGRVRRRYQRALEISVPDEIIDRHDLTLIERLRIKSAKHIERLAQWVHPPIDL